MVFGPIAVTYNVTGVTSLNLDGPTTAKIFNGTIKTWNDPAITALNAGTALPDLPIHVVFRSDQSGTTDNFQQYLDGASDGAWGKGHGKSFNGGVGEGAKGNDGTSAAIKNTPGFDHLQRMVVRPGPEAQSRPRSSRRRDPIPLRSALIRSARRSPRQRSKGRATT